MSLKRTISTRELQIPSVSFKRARTDTGDQEITETTSLYGCITKIPWDHRVKILVHEFNNGMLADDILTRPEAVQLGITCLATQYEMKYTSIGEQGAAMAIPLAYMHYLMKCDHAVLYM